ncbi:hypothetical protein EB001_26940, partial [bacterium]|nr:hypothetical protein [bacterium]
QRTKNIRAKTLATNYHETMNNINTATVMPVPRCYSDMSSSIHTQVVVGKMDCCAPIARALSTPGGGGGGRSPYYIDVIYTAASSATFPSGSIASSIVADPRLASAGISSSYTSPNITITFTGAFPNNIPSSVFILYASGALAGTSWLTTPQYTLAGVVAGGFVIVNGRTTLTTLWSTFAGTGRYSGAVVSGSSYTFGRIIFSI